MDQGNVVGPVCLTIAGFDPSGGAGILADSRTFIDFGCSPAAAVTSLTFQNDRAVFGATHQSPEIVRDQVKALFGQSQVAAVKTGMLPTIEIVREVAQLIRQFQLPAPVVDPVLQSSSGFQLMEPDAITVLLNDLMPLVRVITPNIPEVEQLTGLRIEDDEGMRAGARKLREIGARAVLVKGGHRYRTASGRERVQEATDLLDDGGDVTFFRGEWIDAPPVRGTGCMLSAAMAACLAKGMRLEAAVGAAKKYVTDRLRTRYFELVTH